MATPRNQKAKLVGVWRLVSLTSRSGKVGTSQTHLVIREHDLWEVWPGQTYFQDEPSPLHRYYLTWTAKGSRLEIVYAERSNACAVLRVSGDTLRLRWNSVAGIFPASFDDAYGELATFKRERDAAKVAALSAPPEIRVKASLTHPRLGLLRHDPNLGWWERTVISGEWFGFKLTVDGPLDIAPAALDRAADLLEKLRIADVRAAAARELLELARDWSDNDGSGITEASFAAVLEPESFGVGPDGSVVIYFKDGGLFHGHGVMVSLTEALAYDRIEMC